MISLQWSDDIISHDIIVSTVNALCSASDTLTCENQYDVPLYLLNKDVIPMLIYVIESIAQKKLEVESASAIFPFPRERLQFLLNAAFIFHVAQKMKICSLHTAKNAHWLEYPQVISQVINNALKEINHFMHQYLFSANELLLIILLNMFDVNYQRNDDGLMKMPKINKYLHKIEHDLWLLIGNKHPSSKIKKLLQKDLPYQQLICQVADAKGNIDVSLFFETPRASRRSILKKENSRRRSLNVKSVSWMHEDVLTRTFAIDPILNEPEPIKKQEGAGVAPTKRTKCSIAIRSIYEMADYDQNGKLRRVLRRSCSTENISPKFITVGTSTNNKSAKGGISLVNMNVYANRKVSVAKIIDEEPCEYC